MSNDELIEKCYGGTFAENTKSVLQKHFDKAKAEELWAAVEQKYFALASDFENESEDELFYILPSVAVYKTLQSAEKENALEIFREIYYIDGKRGHDYLSNRLNSDEAFLKDFTHIFVENEAGENAEVIADTDTFAEVHIKACRFVALTKELGCPEICSAFCGIDEVIYNDIHPTLCFERDKTIFKGDEYCNFCMHVMRN